MSVALNWLVVDAGTAMAPLASAVPTSRGSADDVVPEIAATPLFAVKPAKHRSLLSEGRISAPAEVAVLLNVNGVVPLVGIVVLPTSVPAEVYSSRNVAVLALFSIADPSPTRTTTRSPGVNPATVTVNAVPALVALVLLFLTVNDPL